MMRTSEYIEEVIEESYLLGLSDSEIRANLDQFIETCGRVIRDHVHDKKQMQILAEKLARARALSLIEDHREGEWGETKPAQVPQENLAERVARNKRLILRAIGECDPRLVLLIDQVRFPKHEPVSDPAFLSSISSVGKTRRLIVKIGFLVAILSTLLLAYLILLQNV